MFFFRNSRNTGQKITVTEYMKGYALFHLSVFYVDPIFLKMSIECNFKALDEGRNDHVYTKNERG